MTEEKLELFFDGFNGIMRVSGNRRPRGGRSGSGNGRSGSSGGRNGSNSNRRSNSGNRSYDSNGPDGKIRGSASQVYEKYTTLARDAQTSGDPVAAENYYQHAEHYFRIMLANNLVKQDKSSEPPAVEETSSDSAEADNNAAAETARPEKANSSSETGEGAKGSEDAVEPVIIDLSSPEAPELDLSSPEEEAVAEDGATESEGPEEKPKTKRRVSRTRGLRRRANRRNEDTASDEPQTAE